MQNARTCAAIQPAIVHGRDFRLVTASDPARAGESIVIFGTGLGLGSVVGPAPEYGSAAPYSPLLRYAFETNVEFEKIEVKPSFTGATPGFVGLDQMNVTVPAGLPPGPIRVRVQGPPAVFSGTQPVRMYLQ